MLETVPVITNEAAPRDYIAKPDLGKSAGEYIAEARERLKSELGPTESEFQSKALDLIKDLQGDAGRYISSDSEQVAKAIRGIKKGVEAVFPILSHSLDNSSVDIQSETSALRAKINQLRSEIKDAVDDSAAPKSEIIIDGVDTQHFSPEERAIHEALLKDFSLDSQGRLHWQLSVREIKRIVETVRQDNSQSFPPTIDGLTQFITENNVTLGEEVRAAMSNQIEALKQIEADMTSESPTVLSQIDNVMKHLEQFKEANPENQKAQATAVEDMFAELLKAGQSDRVMVFVLSMDSPITRGLMGKGVRRVIMDNLQDLQDQDVNRAKKAAEKLITLLSVAKTNIDHLTAYLAKHVDFVTTLRQQFEQRSAVNSDLIQLVTPRHIELVTLENQDDKFKFDLEVVEQLKEKVGDVSVAARRLNQAKERRLAQIQTELVADISVDEQIELRVEEALLNKPDISDLELEEIISPLLREARSAASDVAVEMPMPAVEGGGGGAASSESSAATGDGVFVLQEDGYFNLGSSAGIHQAREMPAVVAGPGDEVLDDAALQASFEEVCKDPGLTLEAFVDRLGRVGGGNFKPANQPGAESEHLTAQEIAAQIQNFYEKKVVFDESVSVEIPPELDFPPVDEGVRTLLLNHPAYIELQKIKNKDQEVSSFSSLIEALGKIGTAYKVPGYQDLTAAELAVVLQEVHQNWEAYSTIGKAFFGTRRREREEMGKMLDSQITTELEGKGKSGETGTGLIWDAVLNILDKYELPNEAKSSGIFQTLRTMMTGETPVAVAEAEPERVIVGSNVDIYMNGLSAQKYRLKGRGIPIGSGTASNDPGAEIDLTAFDLKREISPKSASLIRMNDGGYKILNLGVVNSIHVNEQGLLSTQFRDLKPGDVIRFGPKFTMRFTVEENPETNSDEYFLEPIRSATPE